MVPDSFQISFVNIASLVSDILFLHNYSYFRSCLLPRTGFLAEMRFVVLWFLHTYFPNLF